VVYTSLDQVYSQPILERFERETGTQVQAVYDTEATKTTGLANRLLAEKAAPQADVFWNSEVVRTVVLAREGVLAPYKSPAAEGIPAAFKDPDAYWTGFAARARVLAVNPSLLPREAWPTSFDALLEPQWRGRFAMAYPLFGTTATHVAARFAWEGPEAARAWLRGLAENGALLVDGNSTARDLVVAGTVPVAMTDSDDVAAARHRGDAIEMVFADANGAGALVIPNTVALVAGAPHPDQGRRLIDFLLSPEVEVALAEAPGAQIPVRPGLPWPAALPPRETLRAAPVDFGQVADFVPEAVAASRDVFVR
jgi:iron(III) transport system substrate-binding protein